MDSTTPSTTNYYRIQQALLEPIEYKEAETSSRVKECSVRDALASLVGGESEVETPAGFIDVLSETEVIEVKYYRQWKHGLGQVLAYQSYYPCLARRLHLFAHVGDVDTRNYFALAKNVCDGHEVKVTSEEVPAPDDDETQTPPRVKRARDYQCFQCPQPQIKRATPRRLVQASGDNDWHPVRSCP